MVEYEPQAMRELNTAVARIPGASVYSTPGKPYLYEGRPTISVHIPYESVDGEAVAASVRRVTGRHGELEYFSPEGNSTILFRGELNVGTVIFLGDAAQLITPEQDVLAIYREILERLAGEGA